MSKQAVESDGKIYVVDTDKNTYEEAKPDQSSAQSSGALAVLTGGVSLLVEGAVDAVKGK